jgi:hypothetical protein
LDGVFLEAFGEFFTHDLDLWCGTTFFSYYDFTGCYNLVTI